MESRKHTNGVTLAEMLVVVAVIALLAATVLGIATHIGNQSKERALKNTFALLESALQEYYDFKDIFPAAGDANPNVNCEILYAELNYIPGSRKVLEEINDKLIQNKFAPAAAPPRYEIYDLWGTVIDYRYNPGDSFPELISAGPDKTPDTGDDITNR